MLELVFVIVIIGIISAMVIPRMDRDSLFEAADQTLKHIKYTQHLAMTQDVYDDTLANWFRRRWEIQFFTCGGYAVHSDTNMNNSANAARNESAVDPQTGKFLYTTATCTMPAANTDYERVNLAGYFGITDIGFSAGCAGNQQISFDTLGRPYITNSVNGVLKNNCEITLTSSTGSETIRIHPETGYACILNAAQTACL